MSKHYSQEEIYDLVTKGYIDARKNERCKYSQIEYELNQEVNNAEIASLLYSRTWNPSPAISFITLVPVPREIFAPQFKDRVVSHVLYNLVYPIFEKYFIYDSYSCRIGKGTLFGIERIEHHIRSCSNNYKEEVFILNLDISGYFMNIKHDILFNLVSDILEKERVKFTKDNILMDDIIDFDFIYFLVKKLIFRDPSSNCIYIGDNNLRKLVPKQKLLKNTPSDTGLIIGDVMSQVFSNVYLNPLDHYVKRRLMIKYYGRYVDDSRLIHKDKEYLMKCLDEIEAFLKNTLNLKINRNKTTITSSNKENYFLGAVILPFRRYINNISLNRFKKYVKNIRIEEYDTKDILAHLNSYLGYLSNYKNYTLSYKILNLNLDLFHTYHLSSDHNKLLFL